MDTQQVLDFIQSMNGNQLDSAQSGKKRGKYVRRACDGCKKNHLKCDGASPQCQNCLKSGSSCSWDTLPAKRGRKRKAPANQDLNGDLTPVNDIFLDLEPTGPSAKAPRLVVSIPADSNLNKNHGHFAFVVGSYFNRLQLFLDLPATPSFLDQSELWSTVASLSSSPNVQRYLEQQNAASLIRHLEYAAASLIGCLNSAQNELQRALGLTVEVLIDHILNVRELHFSSAFADFAEPLVASHLAVCYHYCFANRHHKWRQAALQAWDVVTRFPDRIRPQTRQSVAAMLVGTEHDAKARSTWQLQCISSGSTSASSLTQSSMWLSLATFLPNRFDPNFEWSLHSLFQLKDIDADNAALLFQAYSVALQSVDQVSESVASSSTSSIVSAWRSILSACEVLRLLASNNLAQAQQLAKLSLLSTLAAVFPDRQGFVPTVPFFACTSLFICALAVCPADINLALRVSYELERIGTPKTLKLSSILQNCAAQLHVSGSNNTDPYQTVVSTTSSPSSFESMHDFSPLQDGLESLAEDYSVDPFNVGDD